MAVEDHHCLHMVPHDMSANLSPQRAKYGLRTYPHERVRSKIKEATTAKLSSEQSVCIRSFLVGVHGEVRVHASDLTDKVVFMDSFLNG